MIHEQVSVLERLLRHAVGEGEGRPGKQTMVVSCLLRYASNNTPTSFLLISAAREIMGGAHGARLPGPSKESLRTGRGKCSAGGFESYNNNCRD